MTPSMNKRLLQIAVAALALVPVGIGALGVLAGPGFLRGGDMPPADMDSHFRYLSGIFLALGLMFYACIPAIERKTSLFRMAAALVIVGGCGRLLSLLMVGPPSSGHLIGLGLELVIVPLLTLWQSGVARAHAPLL